MRAYLRSIVFVAAIVGTVTPSFADFITLPFVGDILHPDLDPFHIFTPEPAPAPEPAAPAPHMHHHHHHHHHKMK